MIRSLVSAILIIGNGPFVDLPLWNISVSAGEVTQVQFKPGGPTWSYGKVPSGHWILEVNHTAPCGVPIDVTATYKPDGTRFGFTPIPAAPCPDEIHLSGGMTIQKLTGGRFKATVKVTVLDGGGNPLPGAPVSIRWITPLGYSGIYNGVTRADGTASTYRTGPEGIYRAELRSVSWSDWPVVEGAGSTWEGKGE